MYHYIDPPPREDDRHAGLYVPPGEFRGQLALLTSMKIRSVTPEEYDRGIEEPGVLNKTAWITFDDGRIDNYQKAFPLLAEAGHRATFFVVAGDSLGGSRADRIGVSMMREMLDAGMSIGSHTLTHPRLARLDAETLRREVRDSKARLEDALGTEVASFCYPFGNWNAEVIQAVKDAGYRLAVSTIRGNRNGPEERWTLKRAMVQPGRTGLKFRYLFSPLYSLIHERKNRRRWKSKGAPGA